MSMPGLDAHLERGYTDQRDPPEPTAEQYARARQRFLALDSSTEAIDEIAQEIYFEDIGDDDHGCDDYEGADHGC